MSEPTSAPADPVAAAIHLERTRARVFGQDAATWEGVGLPERLATRLRDASTNRGFAVPTRVQRAASPHIVRGVDVRLTPAHLRFLEDGV